MLQIEINGQAVSQTSQSITSEPQNLPFLLQIETFKIRRKVCLDLPLFTAPILPAGLLGNISIYPKCVANGTRYLLTGGANIMPPGHARQGVVHEHFHEVPGRVQLHLADGSPRVAEVRPWNVLDALGCAPLLPSMIAHPPGSWAARPRDLLATRSLPRGARLQFRVGARQHPAAPRLCALTSAS